MIGTCGFPGDLRVERMHMPGPTPDDHIVTIFTADGSGALMTMRMSLPDEKTRNAMPATGMEHGMEAGYVRLETLFQPGLDTGANSPVPCRLGSADPYSRVASD